MGPYTILDRLKDVYYSIEYFFAKRWLDRNFGKQEYWGDYLSNKLRHSNAYTEDVV